MWSNPQSPDHKSDAHPTESKWQRRLCTSPICTFVTLISLAPRYEFYISNLTKVKYSSLTIFLHILSPYQSETHNWSTKSERRTFQKIGFCKIYNYYTVFMRIHRSVRREPVYTLLYIRAFSFSRWACTITYRIYSNCWESRLFTILVLKFEQVHFTFI